MILVTGGTGYIGSHTVVVLIENGHDVVILDNNVLGSIQLFKVMREHAVKKIIFSSSATVYGDPGVSCYGESIDPKPVNVYGRTKRMIEEILQDIQSSDP